MAKLEEKKPVELPRVKVRVVIETTVAQEEVMYHRPGTPKPVKLWATQDEDLQIFIDEMHQSDRSIGEIANTFRAFEDTIEDTVSLEVEII